MSTGKSSMPFCDLSTIVSSKQIDNNEVYLNCMQGVSDKCVTTITTINENVQEWCKNVRLTRSFVI